MALLKVEDQELAIVKQENEELRQLFSEANARAEKLKAENEDLRKLSEDAVLEQQMTKALSETEKLKAAADAYTRELLQQKLGELEWELTRSQEDLKAANHENAALKITVKDITIKQQSALTEIANLRKDNASRSQTRAFGAGACEMSDVQGPTAAAEVLAAKLIEALDGHGVDADLLAKVCAALRQSIATDMQLQQLQKENVRLQKEVKHLNDTVFSSTFKAPSAWAEREVKYKMEKKAWEDQVNKLHQVIKSLRVENEQYRGATKAEEFEQRIAELQDTLSHTTSDKVEAQKALHALQLEVRAVDGEFSSTRRVRHSSGSGGDSPLMTGGDSVHCIVGEFDQQRLGMAPLAKPPPAIRTSARGLGSPRAGSYAGSPAHGSLITGENVGGIVADYDERITRLRRSGSPHRSTGSLYSENTGPVGVHDTADLSRKTAAGASEVGHFLSNYSSSPGPSGRQSHPVTPMSQRLPPGPSLLQEVQPDSLTWTPSEGHAKGSSRLVAADGVPALQKSALQSRERETVPAPEEETVTTPFATASDSAGPQSTGTPVPRHLAGREALEAPQLAPFQAAALAASPPGATTPSPAASSGPEAVEAGQKAPGLQVVNPSERNEGPGTGQWSQPLSGLAPRGVASARQRVASMEDWSEVDAELEKGPPDEPRTKDWRSGDSPAAVNSTAGPGVQNLHTDGAGSSGSNSDWTEERLVEDKRDIAGQWGKLQVDIDPGVMRWRNAELESRVEMYEVQIRKMALSIERSDDEIGRLEHELATALGLAQRKDSKGLAQMRASLAELKEPRQNDMSQQVKKLAEENEVLMQSLVQTKVELAETQGDYLIAKRALIRAVEKQAALSEKMDHLKGAFAEGGMPTAMADLDRQLRSSGNLDGYGDVHGH